jgi:hypothetical protein
MYIIIVIAIIIIIIGVDFIYLYVSVLHHGLAGSPYSAAPETRECGRPYRIMQNQRFVCTLVFKLKLEKVICTVCSIFWILNIILICQCLVHCIFPYRPAFLVL